MRGSEPLHPETTEQLLLVALKRKASTGRWRFIFISFSSLHIPSAVSQSHLSIFPLLATNLSKCLCFSITLGKKPLFLPQTLRLFFCQGKCLIRAQWTNIQGQKALRQPWFTLQCKHLLWHTGTNSIVCQVSNVASDVIKRNTLALCEERPCRGGSGVIGSGKLNSTSSHLQSESWANQTPFPPELWIPCPHTLQSKGKSRTFLHVLQAHPGFAVHMLVCPQKPGRVYSPCSEALGHLPWTTVPCSLHQTREAKAVTEAPENEGTEKMSVWEAP